MSKADEMGESAAFGRAGRNRSNRGRVMAETMNSSGPTTLALHLLSRNPDNPREEMGDLTDLGNSLRDHKQKQPLAIMTRAAYVQAHPDREPELEEHAAYVVIDGNRRLAAAREAGLKSLKVMLDDEGLGADADSILESALVANVFNKQLEPLEEAHALKQLLKIHGTQEALAERLHRSQPWISTRLALLDLTPELKERLRAGDESAADLRRVGKKPADEQAAALERIKEERAREREAKAERAQARKAAAKKASPETTGGPVAKDDPNYYGVINGDDQSDATEQPETDRQDDTGTGEHQADERHAEDEDGAATGEDPALAHLDPALVKELPWRNVPSMAKLIIDHMDADDVRRLNKHLWAKYGE